MLAGSTPAACAACYGQYPDRAHIDYRAAIEGRLVDPSKPRGRHVDWVVICESCLRAGVALLPENAARRDAAAATEASLRDRIRELEGYAASLEAAVAARPEREHVHPVVEPALKPKPKPAAAKPTPHLHPAKPARPSRYSPKGQS